MKKHGNLIKQVLRCFMASLIFTVFCMIFLPCVFLAVQSAISPAPEQYLANSGKLLIPDKISIYRSASGTVESLDFESYIKGVVASEMPSSFEDEALKAQAVTARTYSLSKAMRGNPDAHPGAPLCDTTHCQVYRSFAELERLKSNQWIESNWCKIENAVESTKGEMIYYGDVLADQTLFFSSSGGKTENSEDVFVSAVPYLKSVDSPYENDATHQNEQTVMSVSAFASALNSALPSCKTGSVDNSNIKILARSEGGRVNKIQVGNATLTGRNIRDALKLSSTNFTLSLNKDSLTITTNGFGHGVGMSQYGANGMAKEGYTYKEILSHYYSGTAVY